MRALDVATALRRRSTLLIWAVCCALVFALAIDGGQAQSRDADASRMQARQVDFPSSHSDRLDPPADRLDWRYFKLSEETRVSIRVEFGSDDAGGEVALTGATGGNLGRASASDGTAALSKQLDPGIYYLSVGASSKTTYKLSLR
jgi:hypothetical protein